MQVHDDGTMTLDIDTALPAFYADCADDDVAPRASRSARTVRASFGQPLRAAAWHDIPSTYVVCTEDRAINPRVPARAAHPHDDARRVADQPLAVLLAAGPRRRPADRPGARSGDPES
jgi:hypothetical protein